MASCNVRSCSTVFLLGGDVTLKVSNGSPLLKCLRQSMRIAMKKKMAGNIYLIHPLHVIFDHFVTLLSLYNLPLKLLNLRNQGAKIINLHQIDSSLWCAMKVLSKEKYISMSIQSSSQGQATLKLCSQSTQEKPLIYEGLPMRSKVEDG